MHSIKIMSCGHIGVMRNGWVHFKILFLLLWWPELENCLPPLWVGGSGGGGAVSPFILPLFSAYKHQLISQQTFVYAYEVCINFKLGTATRKEGNPSSLTTTAVAFGFIE